MKTKLTPSQSQRLIELGVDPSKASMCMLYFPESDSSEPLESWQMWEENGNLLCNPDESQVQDVECVIVPKSADYDLDAREEYPIFDLTDILLLMPKEIVTETGKFQLSINIYKGEWLVGYDENETVKTTLFDVDPLANLYFVSVPELIDALFELLVWCITKGYYQNNTEKE